MRVLKMNLLSRPALSHMIERYFDHFGVAASDPRTPVCVVRDVRVGERFHEQSLRDK